MSLLAECGIKEQELRIRKEELTKMYSFALDSRVIDVINRAYGFLTKSLQNEWSDRRNLSIIQELHNKYDFLNQIFASEDAQKNVEETIQKIEENIFKKKKTAHSKASNGKTSEHGNIADILQYKNTAQITKMLNNTDKSLTKLKPYVGLSKADTIKILEAIHDVCTKEKQKLINDFLGGL